jgi:hypothetical protein
MVAFAASWTLLRLGMIPNTCHLGCCTEGLLVVFFGRWRNLPWLVVNGLSSIPQSSIYHAQNSRLKDLGSFRGMCYTQNSQFAPRRFLRDS